MSEHKHEHGDACGCGHDHDHDHEHEEFVLTLTDEEGKEVEMVLVETFDVGGQKKNRSKKNGVFFEARKKIEKKINI